MGSLSQNYEIIREIGRGGMGSVFLARDTRLNREVAIKMVSEKFSLKSSATKDIIQRFMNEGKAIAKLKHHNIVTIYDIGEENGRYYMVIELIDGNSLSNLLEKGKLFSVVEVIDIGIQICDALDYAHRNGIIHRDIKPANILYSQDKNAKLTDFGVARLSGSQSGLTREGDILGSILYIAPEQIIDAKNADRRSDIYSLGMTMYQLLTGRLPFEGADFNEIIKKIIDNEFTPPRKLRPDISEELEELILKAIKKNPDERFQEANDFSFVLKDIKEKIKEKKALKLNDEKFSKKEAKEKNLKKVITIVFLLTFLIVSLIVGFLKLTEKNKTNLPPKKGKLFEKKIIPQEKIKSIASPDISSSSPEPKIVKTPSPVPEQKKEPVLLPKPEKKEVVPVYRQVKPIIKQVPKAYQPPKSPVINPVQKSPVKKVEPKPVSNNNPGEGY